MLEMKIMEGFMFEGISNSIRNGINRVQQSTSGFIEASGERIRQMVREYITESIPEGVTDVAVKPIQTAQVDSDELRGLTQDPSLENFTKLTNQIGGMFTRTRDHESYSLIIQHLKGNTTEEKAANFRRLFKPKAKEDGSVALVFAPTNRDISECLTENNSRIRAACLELQNATRYAAIGSGDPTIIGSLVAIGYGTAELGAQVNAKLRQIGTAISELIPEQETQQHQTGGNRNER